MAKNPRFFSGLEKRRPTRVTNYLKTELQIFKIKSPFLNFKFHFL